jgi:hypothetical protein
MRSVSHNNALKVFEQHFDFDLLTPEKLLEKFVGRQIGLVKTHPTTGEETVEQAVVLSTNNGVVLQVGKRIETEVAGRLVFPDIPKNLRDRPTLTMTLQNDTAAKQTVELSYLTDGLSWKADYVAEMNADDASFALNGWVTLTNTSGADYNKALLQLVAGDVHQSPDRDLIRQSFRATDTMTAASVPEMAEENLFEYHLYTLDRPTTILDKQTKQVALLQAARIPVDKEYILKGQEYSYRNIDSSAEQKQDIGVFLSFANSKDNNLGMALPRGVIRVYKQDSLNRMQFIGEDRIDHTPENKNVRLRLGNTFDVTATRTQTDFKKLAGSSRYNYIFESGHQIRFQNSKDMQVIVKVIESLPGDWEILDQSLPHTKESATTSTWLVPIPAKGEMVLTYRARIKY